jgi:hypothetical protein
MNSDSFIEFVHTIDPEPKVKLLNFGAVIEYSNENHEVVTAVALENGTHRIVARNGQFVDNRNGVVSK